MTARLFIILKITVTALLLIYIGSKINFLALRHHLAATSPLYLAVALAFAFLQIVIVGGRWSIVLRCLDRHLPATLNQLRIQQINWISQAVAQVLPFLASDATRVMLLRGHGVEMKIAVESALIDRGIALIALFIVAACGMSFSPLLWATGPYAPKLVALISGGLGATILGLAITPFLSRRLRDIRGLRTVCDAAIGLRRLLIDKATGPLLLALALTVHALSIAIFWLLARGNGVDLTLTDCMVIAPLMVLVTMIPIAVGGWGVREIFLITLLGKAGVPTETSLVLALLVGAVGLIAAAPGLAIALIPTRGETQGLISEETDTDIRMKI